MFSYKGVIPFSILVVALSIAYYFVIYLPNKDRTILAEQATQERIKIEQEKEKQQETQKNKDNLKSCLTTASSTYTQDWLTACNSLGLLNQSCAEITKESIFDYEKQQGVNFSDEVAVLKATADYDKKRTDCSCLLPNRSADNVNTYYQNNKNDCFKQYPQN